MKSLLTTNYRKTIKLTSLLILFCLTFHQIKTVSIQIQNNKKRLLKIQNHNLNLKNTINKSRNINYLIESIKKIAKTNYILYTKSKYEHYIYKTPISSTLIKNLINLISNYTNTKPELIINKINNTIELIIPK